MKQVAINSNNTMAVKRIKENSKRKKTPLKLRKFRGYKELVPDPYDLYL